MRISNDPADPHYLDDRPRRVTHNDREVTDWHTADEFRRVVILNDGKVLHGSVGIERLPDEGAPVEVQPAAPIASGFSGVFVPATAPTAAPAPVPTHAPAKQKHKHRR